MKNSEPELTQLLLHTLEALVRDHEQQQRQQVEQDVKTRNALRPANSPYEFSVTEDIKEFKVVLQAQEVSESVIFTLADNAIQVKDDKGTALFDILATFSEDGKCKLYVNESERDFWQVRRMALEGMMFRGN